MLSGLFYGIKEDLLEIGNNCSFDVCSYCRCSRQDSWAAENRVLCIRMFWVVTSRMQRSGTRRSRSEYSEWRSEKGLEQIKHRDGCADWMLYLPGY